MKTFLALLLVIPLLLTSCAKDPMYEGFAYVRHKNADMPVWVRGNKESDIYIIYLHGGPGGSSFIDIQNDFFAQIEQKYSVVYYDQRASGNSIGQSDNSLLTVAQFVEDLDVIVQYIQTKFQPEKIVLMGHSWGGTLGTAYLLEPEFQSKIAGWIEVDGGHNIGQSAYEYSRDYVLDHADSLINTGSTKEQEQWQKVKEYYNDKPSWRPTHVIIEHSKNVTAANGYFFDNANREGLVGIDQILFSETDFLALLSQNKKVIENMDIWYHDYTDRLDEIQIPVMVLWGISDGILPVQLAYEAKNAMQLSDDLFYVFQESGHSPHYEQTELFNEKVITFIEDYVE